MFLICTRTPQLWHSTKQIRTSPYDANRGKTLLTGDITFIPSSFVPLHKTKGPFHNNLSGFLSVTHPPAAARHTSLALHRSLWPSPRSIPGLRQCPRTQSPTKRAAVLGTATVNAHRDDASVALVCCQSGETLVRLVQFSLSRSKSSRAVRRPQLVRRVSRPAPHS